MCLLIYVRPTAQPISRARSSEPARDLIKAIASMAKRAGKSSESEGPKGKQSSSFGLA